MKMATLASGSSGNSSLIKGGRSALLIDAGLSGKGICTRLDSLGINPADLNGILVTHEHKDHVQSVGILARKYKIPVYVLEPCLNAMDIGPLPENCCQVLEQGAAFEAGELKIELFPTSHDSAASTGLICHHGETKVGFATDTGVVSPAMVRKLRGSAALIFEANHDEEMLWHGRYPHYLKKRIAAPTGHLSNVDAGKALTEIIDDKTKRVILAHLSEENNLPDLALSTVGRILLEEAVPDRAPELKVRTAPRYEPLAVGEL